MGGCLVKRPPISYSVFINYLGLPPLLEEDLVPEDLLDPDDLVAAPLLLDDPEDLTAERLDPDLELDPTLVPLLRELDRDGL